MPSIVIATAPFAKLLTVMLRARQAPDAQAVVIAGNPEYIEAEKIGALADRVLAEIVRQLGGGLRAEASISIDEK